jgi:hypothetical protein
MPWMIERRHDHVALVSPSSARSTIWMLLAGRASCRRGWRRTNFWMPPSPGPHLSPPTAIRPVPFRSVSYRQRRWPQSIQRRGSIWIGLSRGMSDPKSLRANARRYRELKGRDITWALPG